MTIQNIQDVMSRIMSLNRNLTEQSLQTLLSASGWDHEDIEEGLRIFRNTAHAAAVSAPVVNEMKVEEAPVVQIENANAGETLAETENKIDHEISSGVATQVDSSLPVERENVNKVAITTETENKNLNVASPVATEVAQMAPETHHTATIVVLILTLILICLAGFYFYTIGGMKKLSSVTSSLNTQPAPIISNKVNPAYSGASSTSSGTSVNPVTTATSSKTNTNPSNVGDVQFLQMQVSAAEKEISDLKLAIQKLSNNSGVGVAPKYITLKGKAGRGIASISATSTGFIINYTDNTKAMIPFSTTTILNIINAQALCLNNSSSSNQVNTNLNCLDRDSLLRLLSR